MLFVIWNETRWGHNILFISLWWFWFWLLSSHLFEYSKFELYRDISNENPILISFLVFLLFFFAFELKLNRNEMKICLKLFSFFFRSQYSHLTRVSQLKHFVTNPANYLNFNKSKSHSNPF